MKGIIESDRTIESDLCIKRRIFIHEVEAYFLSGNQTSYLEEVPLIFHADVIDKFNIVTEVLNKLVQNTQLNSEDIKIYLQRYTDLLAIIIQIEHDICYTDHLTGMFNFNYLKIIEKELNDKDFTLFFFDINKMKLVNDNFGHEYGNKVILGFAKALKGCFRVTDLVFRYGGDEFVAIIFRDNLEVDDIISRINLNPNVREYHISFSVGKYHNKEHDLFNTIDKADHRMYLRKHHQ